ncbi:MAG: tetratricopeptide repeat protein [Hyphomicrobiaceae bacterium]
MDRARLTSDHSMRRLAAAALAVMVSTAALAQAMPGIARAADQAASTERADLDRLFVALKAAPSGEIAAAVEAEIWRIWMQSGDAAIDERVREGTAALQAGALAAALTAFDDVVARAPGYAEGWNKRATVLYMLGQYDRSIADIEQVLTLEPRHFGAISGLGLNRIAKGELAAALAAYRRVLEIEPASASARANADRLSKAVEGEPL